MHWVQNLMKKNGCRRRQSKSPTSSDSSPRAPRPLFCSKHKRRAYAKDLSITEGESLSSDGSVEKTRSAPWRVENIRRIPPSEEEWWEDVLHDSQEIKDYGQEYSEEEYDDDNTEFLSEGFETIVIKPVKKSRRFHNCGLETWIRAREEWTRQTVETVPPKPAPVGYSELVKGLTRSSSVRTFELPRRMALSDLIDVYNDIWDGQGM